MRVFAFLLSLILVWAQEEGRTRPKTASPQPSPSSPTALEVSGTIKDKSTSKPLGGAYIKVRGTLAGVLSDAEERFRLTITSPPTPLVLEASFVGYEPTEVIVSNPQNVEILLQESQVTLREVVISTSRVPEAILEAPVTVS